MLVSQQPVLYNFEFVGSVPTRQMLPTRQMRSAHRHAARPQRAASRACPACGVGRRGARGRTPRRVRIAYTYTV